MFSPSGTSSWPKLLSKSFQLYVLITWRDQTARCRRHARRSQCLINVGILSSSQPTAVLDSGRIRNTVRCRTDQYTTSIADTQKCHKRLQIQRTQCPTRRVACRGQTADQMHRNGKLRLSTGAAVSARSLWCNVQLYLYRWGANSVRSHHSVWAGHHFRTVEEKMPQCAPTGPPITACCVGGT